MLSNSKNPKAPEDMQTSKPLANSPPLHSNPDPESTSDADADPLEPYLHTLHTYTTLRTTLQTQLSTAFLSLSKAQFHSGNSFRYGPDWFDERAHAALRVRVSTSSSPVSRSEVRSTDTGIDTGIAAGENDGLEAEIEAVRLPYSVRKSQRRARKKTATATEKNGEGNGAGKRVVEDLAALLLDAKAINGVAEEEGERDEDGDEDEEEGEVIANPLFQFGMLVPQALRSAQSQFVDAAESMVALVGVERRLRREEERVRCGRGEEEEGD